MILSADDISKIQTALESCCAKISKPDLVVVTKSHEQLREIIRRLKKENGCWCEPLGGSVHTAMCNEIKRRIA